MIFLPLSILASTGIFVCFQLFQRWRATTRHAIMLNYLTAAVFGFAMFRSDSSILDKVWLWPSIALGVLFYVVFSIMAQVTQHSGIAISGLATKMSVVIPVGIGIWAYEESLNAVKIIAILCGLAAVAFTVSFERGSNKGYWPALLFMGSGAVDTVIKWFQHYMVDEPDFPMFVSCVFIFAFLAAMAHHFYLGDRIPSRQSIMSGVILGLINFASLYFLIKALSAPMQESSVVFPVNNFGIILASTLTAVLYFGEKLRIRNMTGIILAAVSIIMLYFSR